MSASRAFGEHLDGLGIWWPRGDGDALREAAAAWTEMAELLDDIAAVLDSASAVVIDNHRGEAAGRFESLWHHWSSDGGYLATTSDDCRRLAATLTDFGTDVDVADRTLLRIVEEALAGSAGGDPYGHLDWLRSCSDVIRGDLAARARLRCGHLASIGELQHQRVPHDRAAIDPGRVSWPDPGTPDDLSHLAVTDVDFGAGQGALPGAYAPPPPPDPAGNNPCPPTDPAPLPPPCTGPTIPIGPPDDPLGTDPPYPPDPVFGTDPIGQPDPASGTDPLDNAAGGSIGADHVPRTSPPSADAGSSLGVGGALGAGGALGTAGLAARGLGTSRRDAGAAPSSGGASSPTPSTPLPRIPLPPDTPDALGDPAQIPVDMSSIDAAGLGQLPQTPLPETPPVGEPAKSSSRMPFFPFMPMGAGGAGGDDGDEPKRRRLKH